MSKKIKQIEIEPGCISCGSCEFICKEIFKVDPTSKVKSTVTKEDLEKYKELIKKAAIKCPVQVIKLKVE